MFPETRWGSSVKTFSTSSAWYSTPKSSADCSPALVLSMNWSWVAVSFRKKIPIVDEPAATLGN